MEFIVNRIADCKECGRGVYDSREQVMVDKRGRCEDCCIDLRCSEKGCENLAHVDSESESCPMHEWEANFAESESCLAHMCRNVGNALEFRVASELRDEAVKECAKWAVIRDAEIFAETPAWLRGDFAHA